LSNSRQKMYCMGQTRQKGRQTQGCQNEKDKLFFT
jgi:hypothetical protein